MLDRTVEELKQQIDELQSDFEKLAEIGRRFQQEIRTVRDREAQEIADSFKTYILNLENTFKVSQEIDREAETQRLNTLEDEILSYLQPIESVCQSL